MSKYEEFYHWFPMELSSFQKTAIRAIVDGHHSLSCVPTGSGKTLPALFAIDYFTRLGKKVIYTSPIKALSNQKYYEFSQKFPTLSVGLLTGDIKTNPTGNVLIMTAEILQNILVSKTSSMMEYVNVERDVGCIIHDEIHMINDEFRGHVWEELIMSCPPTIQMVMLSATLDSPESFVKWIESLPNQEKKVILETCNYRNVPLKHFGFVTNSSKIIKTTKKDPNIISLLQETNNKFIPLYTTNGVFENDNYDKIKNILKLYHKHTHYENNIFVLEQALRVMVEKEMFPAVCFLLSKKQIETISKKITVNLLEFDSKVPYIIQKECENILRQKFSNYKNFLHLPEFASLLKLLEKGIAIHHSGMIPVLRELVEILFEKGFIKLLFATETFSVGLNMPIKTSIFTDIFKFDGNGRRMFLPHEFTQASGRAGRRGLDEEGFVIHLFNLYDSHQKTDFRLLLHGPSQKLVSKFKMSFHLFFSNENINSFCRASLTNFETRGIISSMIKEEEEISQIIQKEQEKTLKTPNEILQEYNSLFRYKSQKQHKKNKIKQENLKEDYPTLEDDLKSRKNLETWIQKKEIVEVKKNCEIQKLEEKISSIKKFLTEQGCFNEKGEKTILGNIASKIHHVPCLGIAQKINEIASLEVHELISLLGCFLPITVPESFKTHVFPQGKIFHSILTDIDTIYNKCYDFEAQHGIYTGEDYTIQFDFVNLLERWAKVTTEEEADALFYQIKDEKGIFLGEFVKYIMNLNNLSRELENVAEFLGDIRFLSKLKQIPEKTIKFIVTNQSLYV